MVKLADGATPLGQAVGLQDQQQAAKVDKILHFDGIGLHPQARDDLKLNQEEFSEWLTDAKAQLGRSRLCISVLTDKLQTFCESSSSGPSDPLLQSFSEVRRHLEKVPDDIYIVLDEFCWCSSEHHFKQEVAVVSDQTDLCSSATTNIMSLQSAITHVVPFVDKIKQFYEADIEAFKNAGNPQLQEHDQNRLSRASTLLDKLHQSLTALISFAGRVAVLTAPPSSPQE